MTDPKSASDLLAQLFEIKNLPCAPDPEPEVDDDIDFEALAVEIWGHWPGPLDGQQQHDLLVEARARGLL